MGYQWVAVEMLTGQLICDLNFLQCGQVQHTVGQYDTVTAQLPIPNAPAGWERAVIPGASAFWLLEDTDTGTVPVWGGYVTAAQRDHTDLVPVTLATFEAYLDQRYTGTRTYTAEDQNLICQDLIQNVIGSGPQGGLPIRVNIVGGAGQPQTIAYSDQSDQTVYSALQALTALQDGPEWTITGEWQHNPERITPVFTVGNRVGQAVTPGLTPSAVFDMPGNLVAFQLSRQFAQGFGANSVMAFSSGSGTSRPQSPVQNVADPLRPTFEYRWSPSVSNLSVPQLTVWAQQAAANLAVGSPALTVVARGDQPGTPKFGVDWLLGDDIGYQIGGAGAPAVNADGTPDIPADVRTRAETQILVDADIPAGRVVYEAPAQPDLDTVWVHNPRAFAWAGTGTPNASTSSMVVDGTLVTNSALNPRAVQSGSQAEYIPRWGWTVEWHAGLGPPVDTFVRLLVGTGSVGGSRGFDQYINMDTTPVSTGNAVAHPVKAGVPVVMSVLAAPTKTAPVSLLMRTHDGSAWLGAASGATVTVQANTFTLVMFTYTPPADGFLSSRVAVDSTGWASTDSLNLTELSYLPPGVDYFDGSFAGAWWGAGAWHTIASTAIGRLFPTRPTVPSYPDGIGGVARAIGVALTLDNTRQMTVTLAGGSLDGQYATGA